MLSNLLMQADLTLMLVIVTTIYTAATIALGIIAGKQLNAARASSIIQKEAAQFQREAMGADAMMKIDERLNSETSLSNRRIVFDEYVGGSNGNYGVVAEKVSGELDRLGAVLFVSEQLKKMYMRAHVRKTAKSWVALETWLVKQRTLRQDEHYQENFELLGKEAVAEWARRYPNEKIDIKKIL